MRVARVSPVTRLVAFRTDTVGYRKERDRQAPLGNAYVAPDCHLFIEQWIVRLACKSIPPSHLPEPESTTASQARPREAARVSFVLGGVNMCRIAQGWCSRMSRDRGSQR